MNVRPLLCRRSVFSTVTHRDHKLARESPNQTSTDRSVELTDLQL